MSKSNKHIDIKKLVDLANRELNLQELHYFTTSFQKLYVRNNIHRSTHYNLLENYTMVMKRPFEKLQSEYERYEQRSFDFLLNGKQIAQRRHFLMILQIAQYHPQITLQSINPYLEKFIFGNQNTTIKDLEMLLELVVTIYKYRLLDLQENLIVKKIQQQIFKKIFKINDIVTVCRLLPRLRNVSSRFIQKILDIVGSSDEKYLNKFWFISILEFYSQLPEHYSQISVNNFILKNLSNKKYELHEKIKVLSCLANFQEDDENEMSSHINLVLAAQKNEFLNEIYNCEIEGLNVLTKLKLFNLVKLFNVSNSKTSTKNKLFLKEDDIDQLIENFKRNKISTSNTFENQIEETMIKMEWKFEKEVFFETYYVDFLLKLKGSSEQTVLEADGPTHFWLIDGEFYNDKTQHLRQKIWKSKQIKFGSIPFYLWQKCKEDLHKRILIRCCIQNRPQSEIETMIQ